MDDFGFISNANYNYYYGGLTFKGSWDALNNIPFLQSGVGTPGDYYIVSIAGTTNLDGITDWQVGDWAIFEGATNMWQKINNHNIQAYTTIQDEGITLPQQSVIDFQGDGVTASNGSGKTIVTIPIQPAYSTIKDEGSSLPQRNTINFVGSGVTASDVGGETQVSIPIQPAYSTIQDEGTSLPQQNIIDFQGAGIVAINGIGKTIVTVPNIANLQDWQQNTLYNTGTYVVAVYESEYRLWRAMSTFTSGIGSFPAGNTIATPINSYVGQWQEVSPLRGYTLNLTFSGSIAYNSALSPPILNSNVNNYNPTGLQYCNFLRLTSSNNYNLTGLQQPIGNVNQNIFIVNVGTNNITLNNEDTNSLAPNRFIFGSGTGSNKTLQANEGIMLIYDNITLRWRSQAIQI